MSTAVETKSVSLIETQVNRVNEALKAVVTIKTADDYAQAGEFLKEIKTAKGQVEEFFDTDIADANKLHKSLTAKKKAFMDPLTAAEAAVKNARIAFDQKVEEERRKEQQRLDAEAREKERKEREKLLAKAEKAKDPEKKEELLQQAAQVVVQAPMAQPVIQQTSGVTKIRTWKAEVTDMKALCAEVAAGRVSADIFEVKQIEINRLAAVHKSSVQVPGLRFYEHITEQIR